MSHNVGGGMARNRVANMNDFKAPHEQVGGAAGGGGATNAASNANNFGPTQPKKRRKTAANPPIQSSSPQDLLPPPPTSTFGDTIVASNPFDDTPTMMNPHLHMNAPPPPHMHMNAPPHMHSNAPMHQHLGHGPPPTHMNHPHAMMHGPPPPGAPPNWKHAAGPNGSPLRSMHQMNNTFGLGHPMNPDVVGMPPHVNNMNNRMPPTQMPVMNTMPGGQMNPNMNPNMSSMNPLGQMAQMGPNAHLAMSSPNGRMNNASPNMIMNSPNMGPNGNRMGSASPHLGMNSPNNRLGNSPLSNVNNISVPPMGSPILQNGPSGPNGGMPPMKNNGQMGPPPGQMLNMMANGNAMMMPGQPPQQQQPPPPSQQQQQQQQPQEWNGIERFRTVNDRHSDPLSSLQGMVGGTGPVPGQCGGGVVGPGNGAGIPPDGMHFQPGPRMNGSPIMSMNHNAMHNQQPPHMQQRSQYPPSHLMQQQMPNMPPSMQQRALQQPPLQKGMPPIGIVSPLNCGPMSPSVPQLPVSMSVPQLPVSLSGPQLPVSMSGQMPPNGPKPITNSSEKIYPHDQPIVFNHQNPSAPPIYACGMCHKEINDNDEAIFCDSGCNFFYHRLCTGLSESEFQSIVKEAFIEWGCDKCIAAKKQTVPKITKS